MEKSGLNKELITLVVKAAKDAGDSIMQIYNSGDWNIEMKSDNSPLTMADRASHEIIEKVLASTGLPLLSEEGKSIPYEKRKNWERFWMVDPLDGTKEFIKKNGEFTVNIALIENSRPVWGVVYAPALNKCYYIKEDGSVCLDDGNSVTILEKNKAAKLFDSEGLRVVASRSHADPETAEFINRLKSPVLVSMGSSLKFIMLAENKADVYPRFAPTMEWDTAAAHAILSRLGFEILKQDSDESLNYNKEILLNPSFITFQKSKVSFPD